MAMQALVDSISRCFGAPLNGPPVPSHKVDGHVDKVGVVANGGKDKKMTQSRRSRNRVDDNDVIDARRRQGRALGLELHDQEWDALFNRDGTKGKKTGSGRKQYSPNGSTNMSTKVKSPQDRSGKKRPDMDIGYADVLAKAKEAARPSRHASPRKKPSDRRSEIFRSRKHHNSSFTSRILGKDGVAKALCFANPVHGDTADVDDKLNCDNSITNTLDTSDDTITSTMYFEAKYNSSMEKRPPMPLFTQYKVECNDYKGNALMGIVASGSHKSIHMLQLQNDDGTSRRLFVAADGEKDKTDDVLIGDVDEIEFMESDDESISSNSCQSNRDSRRPSISKQSQNEIIIDSSIISQKHETPPPVKPISGSQSTAYSTTGSTLSNSCGRGNSFTETQQIVAV